MDKNIKNILKKLDDNGYEAYLVGGYVRDYLLGIKSKDIDICTNALPKDLHKLFPGNSNSNKYGGFNFKVKNYNIEITTFRKEVNYVNRKPEVFYINSLKEDIIRRDFTINAICLDKDGKIIDLVNGINDLNKRIIKVIGNIETKLIEDPLRILRAIRFASILNFELDINLFKEIKKHSNLVRTLSNTRIKQELNKILLNKNYLKGLKLLEELNILKELDITYEDDINYVNDICGMWAQLNFPDNFSFTKQETINIINIRKIVNSEVIDNTTLYKYGLYNSLVSAEILNINKKEINKLYNKLPILSEKDLDISNEEIIDLLKIKPSKMIKTIKNELINEILNNNIKNKNNELKKYIIIRKEKYYEKE